MLAVLIPEEPEATSAAAALAALILSSSACASAFAIACASASAAARALASASALAVSISFCIRIASALLVSIKGLRTSPVLDPLFKLAVKLLNPPPCPGLGSPDGPLLIFTLVSIKGLRKLPCPGLGSLVYPDVIPPSPGLGSLDGPVVIVLDIPCPGLGSLLGPVGVGVDTAPVLGKTSELLLILIWEPDGIPPGVVLGSVNPISYTG